MIEKQHPTIDKRVAAFERLKLNFELVEDNIGSKNPKAEVIPANKIARKNKGAKTLPTGPMILKIIGNTTNTRLVPSETRLPIAIPECKDMNPRMENTPNAVKISKNEFAATTTNTLSVNLEFSGK